MTGRVSGAFAQRRPDESRADRRLGSEAQMMGRDPVSRAGVQGVPSVGGHVAVNLFFPDEDVTSWCFKWGRCVRMGERWSAPRRRVVLEQFLQQGEPGRTLPGLLVRRGQRGLSLVPALPHGQGPPCSAFYLLTSRVLGPRAPRLRGARPPGLVFSGDLTDAPVCPRTEGEGQSRRGPAQGAGPLVEGGCREGGDLAGLSFPISETESTPPQTHTCLSVALRS